MSNYSESVEKFWADEFRVGAARDMALTCALFDAFPALFPRLVEHVCEYEGDVLSTIALADLAQAMAVGEPDVVEVVAPVLDWLSDRVEQGDPDEVNCIAVGFVEGLPLANWPGGEFRATLPPVLAGLQ